MATGVTELLDMLFQMVDEAKNVPLSSDKCMLDREKALDLIDEIRSQFPTELIEARKIVATRNDYLISAKREADNTVKQAREQAKQLVAEDEILRKAKLRGMEIIRQAEDRARELRKAANDYCEDALRRTEEAVAEAHDEIKRSRTRFRAAATGTPTPAPGGVQPFDAEAAGRRK